MRNAGARNGTWDGRWDGRGGGTKRDMVRDQTGGRTKGKRKVGQDKKKSTAWKMVSNKRSPCGEQDTAVEEYPKRLLLWVEIETFQGISRG